MSEKCKTYRVRVTSNDFISLYILRLGFKEIRNQIFLLLYQNDLFYKLCVAKCMEIQLLQRDGILKVSNVYSKAYNGK